MTSRFTASPLGGMSNPGICVTGLAGADLADPALGAELRALWIDKGLIVFRGLAGTEAHLALSRVFGSLTAHPTGVAQNAEYPELSDINFTPDSGNLTEVGGKLLGNYLPWHSDLVYFAEINRGGILRAIQPAAKGGMTGFIDQVAAYERLPDTLKQRIDGLRIVYWGDFRLECARYAYGAKIVRRSPSNERIVAKRDMFPRVAHPMVYVQAETGRKVLNVSPWFAQHIEGMNNSEGMALLDEVVAYCNDERYAYFHRWEAEDMVLWDNWRMLHSAAGTPPDAHRIMQRTTILGDYGFGRVVGKAKVAGELEQVSV